MSDDTKTNIVDFRTRQLLKQAEPAISQVAVFRNFYDDNCDIIQCFVDFLVDRLVNEYSLVPEDIKDQDYTLLMEAAMAVVMRAHHIEHPLCHEWADKYFYDRPQT